MSRGAILMIATFTMIMIMLLSSCGTVPKQPDPVPPVVDKIVTALPDADNIPDTDANPITLPIDKLSKSDRGDYSKIAKAYVLSIEILRKERQNSAQWIRDYKRALERVQKLRDEYMEKIRKQRNDGS